jgi:hypothetical protein
VSRRADMDELYTADETLRLLLLVIVLVVVLAIVVLTVVVFSVTVFREIFVRPHEPMSINYTLVTFIITLIP